MQLSSLDLNQLVVLDALLQTTSVKQAAARVSLSASATSHALARLREQFDDPLLLRAGRAMVLSARGEALRPAVHEALAAVAGVYTVGAPVEAAHLKRAFTVLTTDYGELIAVQEVGAAIARQAPGVDLFSRRATQDVVTDLREGTADLAIGVYRSTPPDVQRQPLFHESFVSMVRRGHPVLEAGLNLDAYCTLDHVLVAPTGIGRGVVDHQLEALGRRRRVARTVASFLAAPHAVAGTDYIVTLASRVARRYAEFLDLVVLPPPLPLSGFTVSMLWHLRSDRDGPHAWLREQFHQAGVIVT